MQSPAIFSIYRKMVSYFGRGFLQSRHGEEWIKRVGHREYVGGFWEEQGTSQLLLLIKQGLKPHHTLLDIGCGSLRGGIPFMRYLEPGHYLGLEKEPLLLKAGIEQELGDSDFKKFKPEIVLSTHFEFQKFLSQPDFALAHSVFTHLVPDDIRLCLTNLKNFSKKPLVLFATFFVGSFSKYNFKVSRDHMAYYYTEEEIRKFASQTGWNAMPIEDWSHPKGQKLWKLNLL